MSRNPLGREIVWDYVRINKEKLLDQYGLDDLRIGQMILDISETFENDFLLGEVFASRNSLMIYKKTQN